MAEQDVLPSYYDSLVMYYIGIAREGDRDVTKPGPDLKDDPTELLTSIGNWADFCVAPRGEVIRHPLEPIDNFPDGAGTYSDDEAGDPWGDGNPYREHHDDDVTRWRELHDNRPDNLPMPGLTVDSFFDAANMLTGSDLDSIGELWAILRDDHEGVLSETMSDEKDPGDGPAPDSFFGIISNILNDWEGDAADAAHNFSTQLSGALKAQVRMTGWLADSLMAYQGIVLGSRRRMLDLMRAFRAAMRNTERSTAEDDATFVAGMLASVTATLVTAGVAIMTAPTGLGIALTTQFISLGINLTNQVFGQTKKSGFTGSDYATIAVNYLDQAGVIVSEMKDQIANLLTQTPVTYFTEEGRWPKVPDPLVTKKQFDNDPGAIDDLEPHD